MSIDDDLNDSQERTVMSSTNAIRGALKQADEAPPALVVLVGPSGFVGRQWLLNKTDLTIGRSPDCDIYVDDKSLSRSHAKISLNGFDVAILDMNSTNKTSVNEQTLASMVPRKLQNNDRVKTGNVIFRYLEKGSIEVIANQHLLEKSQKDALTSAYSKGALLEKGPESIKRSQTLGEPLSVITFDLDHFKKINDNFGHPGGDYVLRELGTLLQSNLVRSNDYFARYGGEEFVIILQATNLKTASEVADRIRHTVENHQFIFESKRIPVTISIGVAQFRPDVDSWETIYERADKALYESKQTGRNKVTLAS